MEEEKDIRKVLFSNEFIEFLSGLDERTKGKFGDNVTVLKKMYVLSTKIVKNLLPPINSMNCVFRLASMSIVR
jgi:hypothetical protein